MPTRSASALVSRSLTLGAVTLLALVLAGSAAAQGRPSVVLAASANDGADVTVAQGTPVVIMAVACGRGGADVTLTPGAGGWAGAFRVGLAGPDGAPVATVFAYAGGPAGPVALEPGGGCPAWAWTLGPEATSALAAGAHTLAVRLVLPGVDTLRARTVRLRVVPAPAAPTAAEAADRLLAFADYADARGDTAAARAHVEALVAAQPGHAQGRLRQADALMTAGRPIAALLAIEAALAALPDSAFTGDEPPLALLVARRAALAAAEAATAFEVTWAPKTAEHPAFGTGAEAAFVLDGIPAREPVLRRGVAYTFRLRGVPAGEAFALTTDAAGTAPYTVGVEGSPATGDGALRFTPGDATPATLYYTSVTRPHAGWRLHIDAATPTAADPTDGPGAASALALSAPAPNPTQGTSALTLTVARPGSVTVAAYDVLGRRVAVLHDGPAAPGTPLQLVAETRGWPAGLYLVRATGGGASVTRSLTVAR